MKHISVEFSSILIYFKVFLKVPKFTYVLLSLFQNDLIVIKSTVLYYTN